MTLSPFGLSVGRSAARLGGIALYLTASTAVVGGMIGFDGSLLTWITTLSDIGGGLLTDSSWLLPALLAVNVTLIAVVAAQSFAGTEPEQVARTQTVIAGISQTVGAFALMTMVLATISAVSAPASARHLLPMYFLAFLVVVFGLWANVVVFGKPKESLRLSKASRAMATTTLGRLHEPTHTRRQAWFTVVATALILGAACSVVPIGISIWLFGDFRGVLPWILICVSVTTFACVIAGVGSAVLALSEPGVSPWLMYITVVGSVTAIPAVAVATQISTTPIFSIPLAVAFVAPVIATWIPYGGSSPRIARFGFGNAVRSLAHFYVSARTRRLDGHILQLEREVTLLDMSATRES